MNKLSVQALSVLFLSDTRYLGTDLAKETMIYKYLAKPLLFRMQADSAHELAIKTASTLSTTPWLLSPVGLFHNVSDPALSQKIWGLTFSNPVGLAAGFDKNATAVSLMERLGFGFIEVGSVTANPSAGNPKPRSFRLPEDRSLINRMGLNNDGAPTVSRRLQKLTHSVPLGVNIAKTHNPEIIGEKALGDYKESFDLLKDHADYVTINISCPNTEEGKTFEEPEPLNDLLELLEISKDSSLPPILVKFSVDLDRTKLEELLAITESHNIDGYVATNTSSGRDNLSTPHGTVKQIGKGGLSGRAIADRSTEIIRMISEITKGDKPIIGVGGISDGEDAIRKLKAGADLLQIYTSMIYEGPGVVRKINKELSDYMKKNGLDHIWQIRS